MGDVLQVGPLRLRFQSSEPAIERRMYRLFGSFPVADDRTGAQVVSVEPERRRDELGWSAAVGGRQVRWETELALVEDSLIRKVTRLVLDAETDRLHLHAGAVERDAVVVLIVGPSGSGKSTLVASLVSAGWNLLSDEQLGVLDGGRLVGFPRPITLRRKSWPLFDGLDVPDTGDRVDRVEVPVEDLGSVSAPAPAVPALVVLPDVSVIEHRVERLRAADVVAALVADTLDLERAGDAGVDAIVEIAARARGVRICGTDLTRTHAAITRLVSQTAVPTQPLAEARARRAGDARAPASRAWLFSDRSAAIYDGDGGALAVVDEAGFDAWCALGRPRDEWSPEMAGSRFVARLTEAGLLEVDGDPGEGEPP